MANVTEPKSSEARVVRGALRWGTVASIPAIGIAAWLRGPEGAISVGLAAAMVLANTWIAAALSGWAGRKTAAGAAYMAMPSFFIRMALIFTALSALRNQPFVDAPTFAVTFGVAVSIVMALEIASWRRTPWIALTMKETP